MLIARQSTARTVTVGPVLDADGVAVTDAVVADFEGSVNGGDPAALNGSATLTHRGVGFYSLALTATDLATVGSFEVCINDTTNACPMKEITVVEEAVYDALFGASAVGYVANAPVNVAQWLGTNAATPTTAGVPEVDVTHWLGTAAATPDTAGIPHVNLVEVLGVEPSVAGTVDANVVSVSGDTTAADTLELFAEALDQATGQIDSGSFAAGAINAAAVANGAIDAATFAADVDAEILSYLVDDATRIDASALNTAAGTTIPAILDDTDLIDDGTSGLAKIATDVAAVLVDTGTTLDALIAAIKAKTDLIPSTAEGLTPTEICRIVLSALAGKASGLGTTTAVFRDLADTKDRITATVDGDGNRTAVTRDAS
jgi:hypothetical protein